MPQPVDYDALAGRYDERYAHYRFAGLEGSLAQFARGATRLLEVGCGTGQWLERLAREGYAVTGLDPSAGMLAKARARAAQIELVQGRAEALPFADTSFDRVYCMNAFHHFQDRAAFMNEARRVLRPGGELSIAGLDPHTGRERWWIYDYYPSALAADRQRYPACAALRAQLEQHGFTAVESHAIQILDDAADAQSALEQGRLDKGVTSQLALMSDAEYAAGIDRVKRDIAAAAARGQTLRFETDLRLFATIASKPEG